MSEKTYNDNGYVIKYEKFIIAFNQPLKDGYDYFISSASHERNHFIGIKRKDKGRSVTTVDSLNSVIRRYKLY